MKPLDNMAKGRSRLLLHHRFFASLVLSTPYEMSRAIPTACTNGSRHLYNPDFMNSLSIEEIMGVMAHETLHDALFHVTRMNGRNPRIWNMACDYSINHIVLQSGLKLPKGVLIDPELGKNSADVNYEILMKRAEEERKRRRNEPQDPQGGDGECPGGGGSGEPEEGSGEPSDGLPEDVIGRDMQDSVQGDPAEQVRKEQEVRQRVAQAASLARMAGQLPAALERLIDQLLNPQIPWEDYLREYMTRCVKSDETWGRRNRRFQSVYLPTRFSERMGEIAVIGDTSGSITGEDLNKVAAEVRSISEQINPERIRMIWSDTEISNEQVFEDGEELIFVPKGGGGTDMRVPLKYVEQYEPEVVVLITDGYTPWPDEEPPYPLIVVCTTDAAVPVGAVIRLN